jgi:hypothetical protein
MRRPHWTAAEHSRLRELAASGANADDIAAALGRPKLQTQRKARQLGITIARRDPRIFTPEMVDKLRWMADAGHPAPSIARALGLTPVHVRRKASQLGVRLRHPATSHDVRFGVNADTWSALAAHAAARGLSVTQLGRLVIEAALRRELIGIIIGQPRSRPADTPTRVGRPRKRLTEQEVAAAWRP